MTRGGVRPAQQQVLAVFEVGPRTWRGVGEIPMSGYRLRPEYARFAFAVTDPAADVTFSVAPLAGDPYLYIVTDSFDVASRGASSNPALFAG